MMMAIVASTVSGGVGCKTVDGQMRDNCQVEKTWVDVA